MIQADTTQPTIFISACARLDIRVHGCSVPCILLRHAFVARLVNAKKGEQGTYPHTYLYISEERLTPMRYTVFMKKALVWGAPALLLALPFIAFAWVPGDPIVPASLLKNAPYLQGCDLITLANNLIAFGVYFSVLVATVMFVYAGILYVTAAANQANLENARKIFGNVLLGLVIVLTAWLIVDIVLTVFTEKDFGFWSDIKCNEYAEVSQVNFDTISTTPADQKTEAENRALIALLDVGVNNPNACPAGQTTGCTTTAGIKAQTIGYVGNTKKQCDEVVGATCDITITGGSEGGHKGGTSPGSHGGGDKVDIRATQNVATYLEKQVASGTFTKVEKPTFGDAQYKDSQTGAVWTLETVVENGQEVQHYDVCVSNCSAPAARGS